MHEEAQISDCYYVTRGVYVCMCILTCLCPCGSEMCAYINMCMHEKLINPMHEEVHRLLLSYSRYVCMHVYFDMFMSVW